MTDGPAKALPAAAFRLAVIGNSHLAMLKLGWDRVGPDHPTTRLTFFAAPVGKLATLRPDGGRLATNDPEARRWLAESSGGDGALDPRDFDAVLFAGFRLFLPRLDRRMSQALRQRVLDDALGIARYATLAKRLRQLSPLPVWLCHEPLWLDLPRFRVGRGQSLTYTNVLAALQSQVTQRRTRILPQPTETITGNLLTPQNFSVEADIAAALADRSRLFDHAHMNGDFGAAWLTENLPTMRAGMA